MTLLSIIDRLIGADMPAKNRWPDRVADSTEARHSTNAQVSEVWREFDEMDALVSVAETNLRARGLVSDDGGEYQEYAG